jgi:hypothetical protein
VVLLVAVEHRDGSSSSSSSNSLHSTLLSNWEVSSGIACVCIDHRSITTTGAFSTRHVLVCNLPQLCFWIALK